jgi:hypothetical protein
MGEDASLTIGDQQFDDAIRRVWHEDRWYYSVLDLTLRAG